MEQQPQRQHRPQPGADRFAWLDREVRMMHGERPRLTGEYWEQPVHRYGGPPADFGYVPQPPPQPPQGHGVGPSAVPVYAAPMQNGSVPLQWQQPQPQAKGPDGEASEMLRNVPITLPTLKDVSEPQAALRAGDWLSELMPLISDVSEGARVWWTGLVQRAQDAYATWLTAGPMDRMAVQPDLQVENKYVRLESRVLSMLLAAVPQTVKQEAISLREMTCVQLVFRILKLYQPGGLIEKNTILNNLTQTTAAKSAAEAGEMLRQWRRQLLRARELGLHVPDPLLHMVQELEYAGIGVNLKDASRVIDAPIPTSGTISTTRRRDVGSVPVWNTLQKTALLVTRSQQVRATKAPREARKVKVRQRMARTTRAKARTGTSRSGEWISLQRIHSLKLPRYNSNLKLLRHNSNLKLPKFNSNLKLLKYNNKFSPQSWVKLPVF